MPPFAGTEAEKRAVAVYLARLGGDPLAGLESPVGGSDGLRVFETHCTACHGTEAPWPLAERLRGRSASELYEILGRLPEVREEMPPFSGTEDERRALAHYLAELATAGPAGNGEVKP
jgi:mono/diheme cytochrome c family protein